MSLWNEDTPTDRVCPECGEPVVFRREFFGHWGKSQVQKSSGYVCEDSPSHDINR